MHRSGLRGGTGLLFVGRDGKVGGVCIHVCGPSCDDRAREEEDKKPDPRLGAPFYPCSGPKSVRGRPGWLRPLVGGSE